MCFHSDSGELKAAKAQAKTAQANADAALAAAQAATANADTATVPATDNEQARQKAEAQIRKLLGKGTYALNFQSGGSLAAPSLGYKTLMGQ